MAYIIAYLGSLAINSDELLRVENSLEYQYIKMQRLSNYPILQIASKGSGTCILLIKFPSTARYRTLQDLADSRITLNVIINNSDYGSFIIQKLSSSINTLDHVTTIVELSQVNFTMNVATIIQNQARIIGSLGSFDITQNDIIQGLKIDADYPLSSLPRLNNKPKLQVEGDSPRSINLNFRFRKQDDSNYDDRYRALTILAENQGRYPLFLLGIDYGQYVIERIQSVMRIEGIIDVSMQLLGSPLGVPKRPKIFSFVVNSVQKVNQLAPLISSINYQDPISGGTSSLDIEFDAEADSIPIEGDSIEIKWGYEGDIEDRWLNTGTHKCDYPQRQFSSNNPSTITISSQSYDYRMGLNSQTIVTYRNLNLRGIIYDIASLFNLNVVGNISSTIIPGTSNDSSSTVEVKESSYTEVLKRLANNFGYRLKMKLGNIYFQKYFDLENDLIVTGISTTDCLSAEFITRTKGIYQRAFAAYKNTSSSASIVADSPTTDYLDLRPEGFYNDINTALARSAGALKITNRQRHTGKISVEGKSIYHAGVNIGILGFDTVDKGKYQIDAVTHKLSPSRGWTSELELIKIF
jgi:phage protein D